jgi:hypothetical protein
VQAGKLAGRENFFRSISANIFSMKMLSVVYHLFKMESVQAGSWVAE